MSSANCSMIKVYKYRLKDRNAKDALLAHASACNQVWNWCVAQHRDVINRYRSGAKPRRWLSAFDLNKTFKGIGRELGIHQQSVACVCDQWTRHRSLRFRSSFGLKRSRGWVPFQRQSRQVDGNSITYLGKRYRFFGAKRRPLPANAKGGMFVEDTLGRWWVCFYIETSIALTSSGREVGIDLGLKDFAVLSDGRKIGPPRAFRNIEPKLATAQRANNIRRAKALHLRAANIRRDFHHKLSNELASIYAFVAVGNVHPKAVAKTRFAKSVLDAGWSAFRTMLRYKAAQYVSVDEKFTTQTCSSCGCLPPERPKGIAGLRIRVWECSSCGASHDRNVNAAKNILKLGRSVPPLVEVSRRAA